MRDRLLEEMGSRFEKASIPVLDLPEVGFGRLALVLRGTPLDESVLSLGTYLAGRFGAEPHVVFGPSFDATRRREIEAGDGIRVPEEATFEDTTRLLALLELIRPDLVLVPEPDSEDRRAVDLDRLVEGEDAPVLVVPRPIDDPAAVFGRILHALTGNFEQRQRQFACSFTLVEAGGDVMLLHAIDAEEVDDVKDALRFAGDVGEREQAQLLEELAHHGEQYLKGVVFAGRERPLNVSYRIEVGPVAEIVEKALLFGGYGLLVVGAHREGRSHLHAAAYQLMHEVRTLPVLAL